MNLGIESETLEFKKTTAEVKAACNSICAMLNKHGIACLYFGVKPNGDVVGQDVSESSLRDVSRAIYDNIKPQIYPVIEKLELDGKSVIVVNVDGNDLPYSSNGRYYLRVADEDREITPAELKHIFEEQSYLSKWEKNSSGLTINSIDKKALKSFFTETVESGRVKSEKFQSAALLKRLGLLSGDNINNAGRVLFGSDGPVSLKLATFATDEKLTFLDQQIEDDNIYNLLQIAENYILRNIRWKSEIVELEREESPEIPVAVIREILANSFAHAKYTEVTTHEICIHPNMITIYNPGTFANKYTPKDYVKENLPSVIRNELIAKALYLCKKIEKFGSGFKRVDSLCKDAGIKYSFENSELGFKFIIYRPKFQSDIQNVTSDVTLNVTLNATEVAVLALLKSNPNLTRIELSERISKTVRTVQRALDSLKEKGYITRIGSKKDSTWVVLK